MYSKAIEEEEIKKNKRRKLMCKNIKIDFIGVNNPPTFNRRRNMKKNTLY